MSLYDTLTDTATNVITSVLEGNSSLWDGLNKHLIATFFEVEDPTNTQNWQKKLDSPIVQAAVLDGSFESTQTWQSTFENAGPEQKAPALTALLQSGMVQGVAADTEADKNGKVKSFAEELDKFKGRTGMTRLNSMQIYLGAPAMNIPLTLLLRAWRDSQSEVEAPLEQLLNWTVPVEMANNPSIIARGLKAARDGGDAADVLMPSFAPVPIGFTYKNRSFFPVVIESLQYDLGSPINGNGNFVSMKVQIQMTTLTSWDRTDIQRSKTTIRGGTSVTKNTSNTGVWV